VQHTIIKGQTYKVWTRWYTFRCRRCKTFWLDSDPDITPFPTMDGRMTSWVNSDCSRCGGRNSGKHNRYIRTYKEETP